MSDRPPSPKPGREERLKQALRANLRRRKAAETERRDETDA